MGNNCCTFNENDDKLAQIQSDLYSPTSQMQSNIPRISAQKSLYDTTKTDEPQLSDRQRALMRSSSLKRAEEITNQYGIASGKLLGRGGFGSVYLCENFVTK